MLSFTYLTLLLGCLFLTVGAAGLLQGPAVVSNIPGAVAKGETVELVKEGFVFTEGPLGTTDGGLFFPTSWAQIERTVSIPAGKSSSSVSKRMARMDWRSRGAPNCWLLKATVNASAGFAPTARLS